MKFPLALIACPISVLAASTSKARQSGLDGPFIGKVWNPNISNAAVNANDGKFYVNKPTETYCPGGVVDCSDYNGSQTIFVPGYDGRLGLQVDVPGGQQIYIAPDGSLSFTQPHSAYIPPGSTQTGFSLEQGVDETYLLVADRQWVICLTSNGERTYQIFAYVSSLGSCFATEIRAYAPGPDKVWEYV